MAEVRVTVAVAAVLRAFLAEPARPRYGYELMKLTGFAGGKLYPILDRLHLAGWLTKEREAVDPVEVGRPARILYRLTARGADRGRDELERLRRQLG